MARDLSRVVAFLKREVIPTSEVELVRALDNIVHRATYTSPEQQSRRWAELGYTLSEMLDNPVGCEWKERVSAVIEDREQIPESWKE